MDDRIILWKTKVQMFIFEIMCEKGKLTSNECSRGFLSKIIHYTKNIDFLGDQPLLEFKTHGNARYTILF